MAVQSTIHSAIHSFIEQALQEAQRPGHRDQATCLGAMESHTQPLTPGLGSACLTGREFLYLMLKKLHGMSVGHPTEGPA
jgi:hypothetical protein